MARRPRRDEPDTWHHVMNRGIARRSVFEDRPSARYFLSRLALAVRSGVLELLAFVLLSTHYRLLVRSPRGELSAGIRQVQLSYVRWFNRRARRDGPLFRSRFLSRRVESLRYRRTLVRYIDQNSVQARLAHEPGQYPYGSAAYYVHGLTSRWLERSWVEADALEQSGFDSFSRRAYRSAFGGELRDEDTLDRDRGTRGRRGSVRQEEVPGASGMDERRCRASARGWSVSEGVFGGMGRRWASGWSSKRTAR